jgi:RNA polymerase sigma-70 factor (ECF subfamily)
MSSADRGRVPLRIVPADAQPDDLELARALISGQPWAPAATWNRYAPLVYGIVSRALGPDAEAEDVTQEVFYYLFARAQTLRDPAALRSFVTSFAIRIVKWELRRRRARRWLTLSESGHLPEGNGAVVDPHAGHVVRRFYRLLDKLGARERLVLVLRHVEGMTLEEVATSMRVSLATVKRLLTVASKRVSTLVDADPELALFARGRGSP